MNQLVFSSSIVLSPDGTALHCRVIGAGPAVVIVPGAFRAAIHYDALSRHLADRFTVHVMNRRGRGGSGPQGDAYSLEKEVEDVGAVLRAFGAAILFGHSYGGLVALEAARVHPVEKLALYEPSVSVDGSMTFPWVGDLDAALARGDNVGALRIFFKALEVDMQEETLAVLPQASEWPGIVELLPTIAPECREVERVDSEYRRYQTITARTLVMTGQANSEADRELNEISAKMLASVVPELRILALPGLDHNAPDTTAPEEVAGLLGDFFASGRGG
jgi:pimeloyl-ACP methyl ester carboxylesterase